jgi:hypothetical protein
MPTRIQTRPLYQRLVLHDARTPPTLHGRDARSALERDAAAANLFFLSTPDDPIEFRVDLHVEESPPAERHDDFQALGGTFRLDLPSGQLVAVACDDEDKQEEHRLEVPPGTYALTAMGRRVFDGRRHEREMIALVGEEDWRHSQRVDRLGLLGCLPMLLGLLGLVFAIRGRFDVLLYVALPSAVLWLPFFLLRRTKRYRGIEARMNQHEAQKPFHILRLVRAERVDGLAGGFLEI